jgi:hypothetical protein
MAISEEKLKELRHKKSTTPLENRDKCPECGSVKIHRRTGGLPDNARSDKEYYCGNSDCRADFDEPIRGET